MNWLALGAAFLGAAIGTAVTLYLFVKKGVPTVLTWLLKNATAALGQIIAGLLGQQLAGLGFSAKQAGDILGRAITVAQGGTVSFVDANDQDIVQGTAAIVPQVVAQFGLNVADVYPVLTAAAARLAARP